MLMLFCAPLPASPGPRAAQLIGTAHGQLLENLIKNPTLSDLVGGICSVTLGAPAPLRLKRCCSLLV